MFYRRRAVQHCDVLDENLPNAASFDIKILATDVSPRVLKEATRGLYGPKAIANLNQSYLNRYFERYDSNGSYAIKDAIEKISPFVGLIW